MVGLKKEDFPQLEEDITYLDSACMSLRPQKVIDKVNEYYSDYSGCSGRSGHSLSRKAQEEFESSREKVASFIDASPEEMMFTSGTTESINTVAQGLDFERVFLTEKEHNSNRAVFQALGIETVNMEAMDPDFLSQTLGKDDLVSMLHVSNLDGEVMDVEEICSIVKENEAYSMIDAAQSIPHRPFSVKDVDPDFVAFSGHKMLGPTGTGGLYVAERVQEELDPLKYGGGAVSDSDLSGHKRRSFPQGFEPGLKNLAGLIGFGAAVDYLEDIGMSEVEAHEQRLTQKMISGLEEIDVNVLNKGPGIVSVVPNSMSSHEAAEIMDRRGIKVRAGQHCVHPWFKKKEYDGTLRASMHLYNDERDINEFIQVIRKISKL